MRGFGNLIEGYGRFRANQCSATRDHWQQLVEGQSPRALIVACCDSRADPATIFDADPGDIFVVRNVANLVPPFEPTEGRDGVSAAIEFAVTQLNVPEIVVMGHEKCGGISAVLTGRFHDARVGEGGLIDRWMSQIDESARPIAQEHGTGPEAHRLLDDLVGPTGPGGVIFSLQDGQAWASWPTAGFHLRLGPRDDVAEMMKDFVAQVEMGKRLTGETQPDAPRRISPA